MPRTAPSISYLPESVRNVVQSYPLWQQDPEMKPESAPLDPDIESDYPPGFQPDLYLDVSADAGLEGENQDCQEVT